MLGQAWSVRHLLPTDRPDWSDESGKEAMPRDAQRLPSDAWVWDGDWRVDLALLRYRHPVCRMSQSWHPRIAFLW